MMSQANIQHLDPYFGFELNCKEGKMCKKVFLAIIFYRILAMFQKGEQQMR